jgi:hypothetical protein
MKKGLALFIFTSFFIIFTGCTNGKNTYTSDEKKILQTQSPRIVWKSVMMGDYIADMRDPKTVCTTIQEEEKMQSCILKESKTSHNEKECVSGASIAGCFACRFECR